MNFARAVFFGCGLLGASMFPCTIRAASADSLFARGVSQFKNGNYSAAAKDFEEARKAGLVTPALYYNLGVSWYRLGRFIEAEEAFRECARDPSWAALATYNMGLAAYARDARSSAREYFEKVWRTADNDNLRTLAGAMLDRLGVPEPRTRGSINANVGYNDNVTLSANDQTLQTTREGDAFLELYGATAGNFGAGANAPRWNASLYLLDYRRLSENDITELQLGLAQPWTAAQWRVEAGVQGQYALRDGNKFQQVGSALVQATHDLSNRRDVRVTIQASSIDALDPNFDFLTGSRQEVQVSVGEPYGAGGVRSGVTWERNNRNDLTTPTEFFSYSPTRYGAWITGVWTLGADWRLQPTASYYRSRYADPDRRANGIVMTRADDHIDLSLRARRRVGAQWQLVTEYTYTRNNSNFSEFSFSQNIVFVGLMRPF